jgi:hypothetical protein
LRKLNHRDLVVDITGVMLNGNFDGFMRNKMLAHVDEADSEDNPKVMQKIKAQITNRDLILNGKYERQSSADFTANLFVTANHPMKFDSGDAERRVFYIKSTAWPLACVVDDIDAMLKARDESLPALLWHLQHLDFGPLEASKEPGQPTHDLPPFDPKGFARETEDFRNETAAEGSAKIKFARAIISGEFSVHGGLEEVNVTAENKKMKILNKETGKWEWHQITTEVRAVTTKPLAELVNRNDFLPVDSHVSGSPYGLNRGEPG